MNPRHRRAARPHDREKRLDAVDAVPEQVGVMRLQRAWPVGGAAQYLADFRIVAHAEDARAETQRRTGETWRPVLLRGIEDGDGVRGGAGDRLEVDNRLSR